MTEELKSFNDVSYVSYTNEERCSVAAAAFDKYVETLCPQMNSPDEDVSNHILTVEADLYSNDGKPCNISEDYAVAFQFKCEKQFFRKQR